MERGLLSKFLFLLHHKLQTHINKILQSHTATLETVKIQCKNSTNGKNTELKILKEKENVRIVIMII